MMTVETATHTQNILTKMACEPKVAALDGRDVLRKIPTPKKTKITPCSKAERPMASMDEP